VSASRYSRESIRGVGSEKRFSSEMHPRGDVGLSGRGSRRDLQNSYCIVLGISFVKDDGREAVASKKCEG